MPESRSRFAHRVNRALDDPKLQKALIYAMTHLRARRDVAFESFDFAKGRAELKRRRQANLDRLPELLEQFAERLVAVGGVVHFAKDAREAREIIGQLCWNAGSGLPAGKRMVVTKSKSMATEEIGLNHYLENLGIEVVETDLGERMVQLTHTHPSHLIAPAIHLTKEDAAAVFGTEPTVEAIQRELMADGFVCRYPTEERVDGLPPGEGAFLACTFWLADNLALQGRRDDARSIFERLLALRNDVGLLAEEYDVARSRLVGNLPQAFTHVGLVNTALNLEQAAGAAHERASGH